MHGFIDCPTYCLIAEVTCVLVDTLARPLFENHFSRGCMHLVTSDFDEEAVIMIVAKVTHGPADLLGGGVVTK